MNTKILTVDSRNKPFHVFGQTMDFAEESHFGDGVPLTIEAPGGIDCTALSTIKIAYSQTKQTYDEEKLWSDTPHTNKGAVPQTTIGTAVRFGLFNVLKNVWEKVWYGYFQADTGPLSHWNNTRSAMALAKSSVMLNTYWYRNWMDLQALDTMPMGDTAVSEHSYVFVDWALVNGKTMAKIDAHLGFPLFMPEEVFNMALSQSGCSALMPSTELVDLIRRRNLLQWLSDCYQNLLLAIQRLAFLKSGH